MIVCHECDTYIKDTSEDLDCDHKFYSYSNPKFQRKNLDEKLEYIGSEETQ